MTINLADLEQGKLTDELDLHSSARRGGNGAYASDYFGDLPRFCLAQQKIACDF